MTDGNAFADAAVDDAWILRGAESDVLGARRRIAALEDPAEWSGVAAWACAEFAAETGRALTAAARHLDTAESLRRSAWAAACSAVE